MSWVSSKNASRGDEAQKAARWLMRQSMKAQEESDVQTVFLLNLLTEHKQELEARDNVMRDSTVLVSKLQSEIQSLREQLCERDAKLLALQRLGGIDDSAIASSCCSCSSAGGMSDSGKSAVTLLRPRYFGKESDAGRAPGSLGGCDASSGGGASQRPTHLTPYSSLQEAWARLRRVSDTPPLDPPLGPAAALDSPAVCRDTSFSPSTPSPRSHLALRLSSASSTSCSSSASSSSSCCSSGLPTAPSLDVGPPHDRRGHSERQPRDQNTAPVPERSEPRPTPPPPEPQDPPESKSPSPVAAAPAPQSPPKTPPQTRPQSPPQTPPQPEPRPLPQPAPPQPDPQLHALVSSLQSQLDAARREAREATSNYLTCRKDLEILTRKYDSLMLQKLEAEEQRDRLFSPLLDVQLIRAAMPAVDAALREAEERLAAAAEVVAGYRAEAEDAARVQGQQRRKWILRLEAVQAQLAEREARLAEAEGQMGARVEGGRAGGQAGEAEAEAGLDAVPGIAELCA